LDEVPPAPVSGGLPFTCTQAMAAAIRGRKIEAARSHARDTRYLTVNI